MEQSAQRKAAVLVLVSVAEVVEVVPLCTADLQPYHDLHTKHHEDLHSLLAQDTCSERSHDCITNTLYVPDNWYGMLSMRPSSVSCCLNCEGRRERKMRRIAWRPGQTGGMVG